MDVKSRLVRWLLISFVFLVVPQSLEALSPRLSRADQIRLESAVDREQIGDTPQAIRLIKPVVNRAPDHERAVRLYFQWLDNTRSDSTVKNEMKRLFKNHSEPSLFFNVLDERSLPPPVRFELLRWFGRNHPRSEPLWSRLVPLAVRVERDTFLRTRADTLLDRFSSQPRILESYARWFESRGELERASEYYRRLIRVRPGSPVGYRGLIRWYRETGQTDRIESLKARASALEGR
jgi:tetratricopeptide (TPR) repeat protein